MNQGTDGPVMEALEPGQIERFIEHGYVCLEQAFPQWPRYPQDVAREASIVMVTSPNEAIRSFDLAAYPSLVFGDHKVHVTELREAQRLAEISGRLELAWASADRGKRGDIERFVQLCAELPDGPHCKDAAAQLIAWKQPQVTRPRATQVQATPP